MRRLPDEDRNRILSGLTSDQQNAFALNRLNHIRNESLQGSIQQANNALQYSLNEDTSLVAEALIPNVWPETLHNMVLEDEGSDNSLMYHLDDKHVIIPPNLPKLFLMADVDSIYGYGKSLSEIKNKLGEKTKFEFKSLTASFTNDAGSRFAINCDSVEDPPFVRNQAAKTVPMNWYPNMNIGVCLLKELNVKVFIQIYNLKVSGFTKVAHFSTQQIAVVNAMLNMAREVSINDCEGEPGIQMELQNMYPFETKVGDTAWQAYLHKFENYLSSRAMDFFAVNVDHALKYIAAPDSGDPDIAKFEGINFWESQYHQIKFKVSDSRTESVSKESMTEFACELKKGILFTFCAAGVKNVFDGDPQYCRELKMTATDHTKYSQEWQAMMRDYVSSLRQAVLETSDDYTNANDVPSEAIEFDDVDGRRPHMSDIDENKFTDFLNFVEASIDVEKEGLVSSVYRRLKTALHRPNRSRWDLVYFDIGVRILYDCECTCLNHIASSEALIKNALTTV